MKKWVDWLLKQEGVIILLGLTVLLRLPSLFEPYWYGDEQIYLTIGQGIRKGLVLYRQITDYPNKPPLIYLLAAGARSVFGFRLILMAWSLVQVIVVNQLLKQVLPKRQWLVWGGSLAVVLLTGLPILEGNIANGEIFMIMPVTLAMLLLWKARYFWAGLMLAVGFLFKIPVAADIAAAGLIFWIFKHSFRGIISFGLGLGLPIAIVLGLWYGMGIAPMDLVKNAVGSAGYVSAWQSKWLALPGRLGLVVAGNGVIYILRKRLGAAMVLGAVWLMWALFGATLSGRPYPHYFIQIVVPVIVIVGAMLAGREKRLKVIVGGVGLALVILTLVTLKVKPYPVGTYYANFLGYMAGKKSFEAYSSEFDRRMPRNYRLARYLKLHTRPEEKIYIWGNQPDVYVLADRLPAGALTVSFHVEDLQAYGQTLLWLNQESPVYVVWMTDETRQFPQLRSWLAGGYVKVDQIEEAEIYRRVKRG